jgi:hypothetical protein
VVMKRMGATSLMPRLDLLMIRAILPAMAVVVSANNPAALCFSLGRSPLLSVTPERIAIVAAYLSYIYLFLIPWAFFFLTAGALALVAYIFGPTPGQIAGTASKGWNNTTALLWKLTPKTSADWGMISVAAAFAFLAIGAAVSLRRTAPPEQGGEPTSLE